MTACKALGKVSVMPQQKTDPLNAGLSETERQDLERMVDEFHRPLSEKESAIPPTSIQSQLDALTRRLADLTEMVLDQERRISPLVEIIRLSHQKSERLNRRLDAVIEALKSRTHEL